MRKGHGWPWKGTRSREKMAVSQESVCCVRIFLFNSILRYAGKNNQQSRSRSYSPSYSLKSEQHSLSRSPSRSSEKEYIDRRHQRKSVKWTASTRDRWSTDSEDENEFKDRYEKRRQQRHKQRQSRDSYSDDEYSPKPTKYSNKRRGAIYTVPDDEYYSGLGRHERRFSLVK